MSCKKKGKRKKKKVSLPGCNRGHGVCSGSKLWAERRAGWGVEMEEKLLSARGSLVWKEGGRGAPSGYQYVPLWNKEDKQIQWESCSVESNNLYTQRGQRSSFFFQRLVLYCRFVSEKRPFHRFHTFLQSLHSQQMAVELFYWRQRGDGEGRPTCIFALCVCLCVGELRLCNVWDKWETLETLVRCEFHVTPEENISAMQQQSGVSDVWM